MINRILEHNSAIFFTRDTGREFFLSTSAAIEVCKFAADEGLVIARIEGGVYNDGEFMPRVACIWDGVDPPVSILRARRNNQDAAKFVETESSEHNAFVITAPPTSGWPR